MSRPRNTVCRELSGHPLAVAKRRWREKQDSDYLRAMNRRHQRAKRERDRLTDPTAKPNPLPAPRP